MQYLKLDCAWLRYMKNGKKKSRCGLYNCNIVRAHESLNKYTNDMRNADFNQKKREHGLQAVVC